MASRNQAPAWRPGRDSQAGDMARDLWVRLQGVYLYLIKYRALRKPAPHEMDAKTAAQALAASIKGFTIAIKSPYVIDKFVKSGTPILATLLVVYLLGRLLLVPIQAVGFLVGASRGKSTEWGHAALTDLVASTALLLMLLLRSWLHKPIFKCFIHTLRDVNPALAQQIETTPTLPNARKASEQAESKPLTYKIGRLLLLSLLSTLGRRTPLVQWFVAPAMLFGSGERLLGTERALMLAALGLVPAVAPWALDFLQLWRASHVTGSELLSDYIAHAIPGENRDEWYRSNEVAIFVFLAPQLLHMKLPIIGPLLFLPASAAAAFLANFLHRQPGNAQFLAAPTAGPAAGQSAAGASPGNGWGLGARKRQTGEAPATRPAVPPSAGGAGKQQ
jgi:hypothetical protein